MIATVSILITCEAKLAAAEGYYWSKCDPSDIIPSVFKIFVPTRFDPHIAPPGCQILIVQRPSPHMSSAPAAIRSAPAPFARPTA